MTYVKTSCSMRCNGLRGVLATVGALVGSLILCGVPVLASESIVGGSSMSDGRTWEMVSPSDKHGAVIEPLATNASGEGGLVQSSVDGSAITYLSDQSPLSAPAGEANLSQVLSIRGSSGWTSQDITTPHQTPTDVSVGQGQEYRFFSSDLSLALVEPFGRESTLLSSEASERTPYLRFDASGTFLPLLTVANVLPGTKFGGNPEAAAIKGPVKFVAATSSLSHVVLQANVMLTPLAVEKGGLYEWAAEDLLSVSVLPDSEGGAPVAGDLGYKNQDVRHAISETGSRIFWTSRGGTSHLYMRDVARNETLKIDVIQPGASGGEEPRPLFQVASSNGSLVLFTDTQQLTEDSRANGENPDLYECEVIEEAGKLTCDLRDLTVDHNTGEPAGVLGVVLGMSDDNSYVYIVANGVLAPGATPGNCANGALERSCNLYVLHNDGTEWTTTFIASLPGEDANDWVGRDQGSVREVTSRVSPNGHYLAFMSERSLTGFNNTDANSGQPDEEVFLYDASRDRLVCASCNPSGARPVGVFDSVSHPLLVDPAGGDTHSWENRWLAGSIPEWTAIEPAHAVYQSRYLSNSGRLFFDSPDALVPQDVNGKEDVYEYEPENVPVGAHRCTVASSTFNVRSYGCVGLISAGTSGEESAFLDASETGDSVFFLTTAKLAPQDVDDSFDVYVAHECATASPCPAAPARGPRPCTTEASCKAAPSPQPEVFAAPASAAFSGAGNVIHNIFQHVGPRRAQRLANALRACRHKARKKRSVCEKRARRAYGSRQKPDRSDTGRTS